MGLVFIIFGFIVGIFILPQIILPIVYSLPKAARLITKGVLRFSAFPYLLISPVLWTLSIGLISLYALNHSDYAGDLFIAFIIGFIGSIVVMLQFSFTEKGRQTLADDFNDTFERFKTTQ